MFVIKPLPEFTEWLDGLSEASVRTQKTDIKRARVLASLLD